MDISATQPMNRAKLADAILSSALDCIVVADVHGRIVEFNAAAERTFGWARADVLGKTMDDTIVPHHHRHGHRTGMERYLAGGAPAVIGRRVEVEGLHASGRVFPLELSIAEALVDGHRFFVATLRDITAQRQAAAELQQARASLQAIFDSIPAALYLRDRADTLVMINTWGARFLGRDPATMIGQPMSRFREPQNVEGVRRADANLLRTGKPETYEFTYHLPGGDRTGLMTFFPVFDGAGQISHFGGMLLDVTELYAARRELDEARSLLEAIFDNIPAVLYLRELDGTIKMVNAWGAAIFGKETAAEVIGTVASDFDTPDEKATAELAQAQLLATGLPVTQEYRRKVRGADVIVLNTIFPIRDSEGRITRLGGFAADVTELDAARRELDEVRALLESIFDNIPAELYLRELDGSFVMMNKWGANFYGKTPQEMIGAQATAYDHGDEIEIARQAQQQLLATERPVTQQYHYKVAARDVTVLNTIFPVKDAEGNIVRIGGITTDVTELHEARSQLQRAQETLHQSEKLAALGQLLAGVAHELNNPLAVVLGRAAILHEKLADTPHAAPLQKLREAANRCARIVKTFLAMARQTGPRRQWVAVDDLIDMALEMTTYGLRTADITWESARLAADHRIEVDQDQIVQVLINLILNAQHALEDRPAPRRLTITAALSANGRWLDIVIADNGPGVPDAIAGRIFDPFFTTKAVGQGTGLGLSVCKSMVEAHGGRLVLEPTPGGGASFRMTLPAQADDTGTGPEDALPGSARKARGRILVVDDEIEIAAILADCLAPLGIDCILATDGHSALQRLTEQRLDAVFCDVSMPGMDGITFYHRLKVVDPVLARHLVFISGDVLHRDWDNLKATVDRPIIEKPFDPQQVRDAALLLLTPRGGRK